MVKLQPAQSGIRYLAINATTQHRGCGKGRKSTANGRRDNRRVCFGNLRPRMTWEFPGLSQAPSVCKFDGESEDFLTPTADIQPLRSPAHRASSKADALAQRCTRVGNVPISAWVLSPRTPHSRFSTTCGRAWMDLYSQSCEYDLIAFERWPEIPRPKTTLIYLFTGARGANAVPPKLPQT